VAVFVPREQRHYVRAGDPATRSKIEFYHRYSTSKKKFDLSSQLLARASRILFIEFKPL
jgi:hypothetical protein